jgi:outer membrane protein TolC
MRSLGRLLLVPLLLLPLIGRTQEAPGVVLAEDLFPELKGLIEKAVEQSPRVLQKNLELAVADGNYHMARSAQLPSAGGSFSFNKAKDKRADISGSLDTDKIYYNFSISQPLYHWGVLRNNTRLAELQRQNAEGSSREAFRGLVNELRGQYLHLIVKRNVVSRARFALDRAKENYRLAEDKLAKKVISPSEMFFPRVGVEEAELTFERAEDEYAYGKKLVGRLAGQPPLTEEQVPTYIPAVTVDLNSLSALLDRFRGTAETDSPSLQSLRRQIESEKLAYEIASKRLYPKFNLAVGTNQDEQSYTTNIANKYKVQSIYAGVSVNWTMFDGFATRHAKKNSLARLRVAEMAYETGSVQAIESAEAALRLVRFSGKANAISDQYLGSAEGGYAFRLKQAERGDVSEADVQASKANLIEYQIRTYESRAELLGRVADFLGSVAQDPAVKTYVPRR